MTGIYVGADGKARKVKGIYIGIDGKARKVKKGYVGDENGIARLCWTAFDADPIFANNTWENVALACQLNAVPDAWSVGDQKTMTIDGWDYTIDIIGKNHDDYADGSGKAPLTFQMHDLYGDMFSMNSSATNEGGWAECDMRKIHLPTIMQLMPIEIQEGIKEVAKISVAGGESRNLVTTHDKLFLLSEIEVINRTAVSELAEGTQYEYYTNGASTKKRLDGIQKSWWTRSPYTASSSMFGYVINDSVSGYNANYDCAVSFAFCF